MAVFDVSCLSSLIPLDVIRDEILPFTYRPQPPALLDDVRSYYDTITHVHKLYCARWSNYDWMDWLSNDVCRFMNNYEPTMMGIVEFYRMVYIRLYMNQSKMLRDVNVPCSICENCSDIKVSIGLLNPVERIRLVEFIDSVGNAW